MTLGLGKEENHHNATVLWWIFLLLSDKTFFEPGIKNQGWHLLQESALFGYFAFTTNQNNHGQK